MTTTEQVDGAEYPAETLRALDFSRLNEPALRDPSEALRQIFGAHGRRRYESGAAEFNGACALIQPSEAFERECASGVPVSDMHGPGAVWAWLVGSPRAFTFGFVGSSSWATRKMRSQLAAEYEAVTRPRSREI
ncbi:hypothetical protein A9R05_42915 (plasmid) [Burkholderia sp. KK1]|uniref:hypothetical protein n=1 Tax=Burkholderia sp. M701 TaxID=326454 RepID=UPI000979A5C6|nr:hypothetical protein [Burkholderia sp. M701]AQH05772.1 hypothetical protein A9R05_42915 [Burkholderia sp. KK1]